jgi:hypothetical protein
MTFLPLLLLLFFLVVPPSQKAQKLVSAVTLCPGPSVSIFNSKLFVFLFVDKIICSWLIYVYIKMGFSIA